MDSCGGQDKKTCMYVVTSRQQNPVSWQQGTTTTQQKEIILGVLVNVVGVFLLIFVQSHPQLPSHPDGKCFCVPVPVSVFLASCPALSSLAFSFFLAHSSVLLF